MQVHWRRTEQADLSGSIWGLPYSPPEHGDGGAIHRALQYLVERGPRRFDAELHLLEDEFRLALDRRSDHLVGGRVKRREARDVNGIAMTGERGGGRSPPETRRASLLAPQSRPFLGHEDTVRGFGGRHAPRSSPRQLKEVIPVEHINVGSVASLGAMAGGEVHS